MNNLKRLAVLGSTGSIGQQTLDVVRSFPGRFQVIALAAGRNRELLSRQIAEFKPEYIYSASGNLTGAKDAKPLAMEDIVRLPDVDMVVIATSGFVGLMPTLAAVRAGRRIALANKEVLVAAGAIINSEMQQTGAVILPVDSEHSAIWQCLNGEKQASAIILTASGGPFKDFSKSELENVTVEQALTHPSWRMGKKVTIDSATLMNKGLEIIEAHWLFHTPFDRLKVVVHPQSVIHSMVEFADGSVKAQLSYPDMRLPIQYALTYPERLPNSHLPRLDWGSLKQLTFEPPDLERFPCLRLAAEAGREGGTYPAVLCAADEVAVELFLAKRIRFTDISRLVEKVLDKHRGSDQPDVAALLTANAWARETVFSLAKESISC